MSQTAVVTHQKAIRKDNPVMKVIGRVLLYTVLIAMALFTLIPFVWMLSSSLKLDQEVFQYPIRWIPETFHWENYRVIWERVSLLTYFKNTAIIALAVTFLQTLTSSFAAYAFAKLRFKGRDLLFVAYIATIAVPWQAYMLPQFIMMRSMGLYDTLLAMIVLQAFSAFGVFLMRQFYQGIPTELCEAARIDGAGHMQQFRKLTLPFVLFSTMPVLIGQFIGNFNNFGIFYFLRGGLYMDGYFLASDTDLLINWLYNLSIDNNYYCIGAAISLIIFFITSAISLVVYIKSPSYREEDTFQ